MSSSETFIIGVIVGMFIGLMVAVLFLVGDYLTQE